MFSSLPHAAALLPDCPPADIHTLLMSDFRRRRHGC